MESRYWRYRWPFASFGSGQRIQDGVTRASSGSETVSSIHHLFKDEEMATDRRPINPHVTVPKPGGGEQPRSRNNDGQIRDKRSDAGKPKRK